jgi:hypothetical protein
MILMDVTPNLPMQCLEGLIFTPTIKNVLVKYMDGYGVSANMPL